MANIDDLVPTLANLPQHEYADLIRQVDAQRRQVVERDAKQRLAAAGMTKDEFAEWIAHQHFAIDKGISRILYLPSGAPDQEVRLLEVNELASLPENGPVEAVDFMPQVEGVDYTLFVADITPRQFQAIRSGKLSPPQGWDLKGSQEFQPGDP